MDFPSFRAGAFSMWRVSTASLEGVQGLELIG